MGSPRRAAAYAELEHPSDLFLEIHGRDLPDLFENALFAFYDQIARIEGFEARRELTLSVREPGLDEALRSFWPKPSTGSTPKASWPADPVEGGRSVAPRRAGRRPSAAGTRDRRSAPAGTAPRRARAVAA